MIRLISLTKFRRLTGWGKKRALRAAHEKHALIQFKAGNKKRAKYWILRERMKEVLEEEEEKIPKSFRSISEVQRYLGCCRKLAKDIIRWSGAGNTENELAFRNSREVRPRYYQASKIQRFLEAKAEGDFLIYKLRKKMVTDENKK